MTLTRLDSPGPRLDQ